ncbi:MAG TPA: cyclic nucleotide-binding domain-containing protein [Actinomycetota bacterium]|nr:cyclic nucleotide-binding domain-containing protein [Actinomycetota bacterium]
MRYLLLAAIVIGGAVVVVDSVRQRRELRRIVPIQALIASALRRNPATGRGPFAIPNQAVSNEDVWETLTERVDPETFVPIFAAGGEVKMFRQRWGNDYAIVARPDRSLHYELQPWEAELIARMDGTQNVGELIVERLQTDGDLDPGAVIGLVEALRRGAFLDPARPDVSALVQDHLDRASRGRRKLREFSKSLKIGWDNAEGFVESAYRGGLKVFFRIPVAIAGGIVAIVGFACFVVVEHSGRYTLSATAAPAETILFLVLALFLTFCHELGHALVLVHSKRRVLSAGFFIFFGSPAFFVDASDGLMMDRGDRIVQSFAGPFAELMLAGIASIVMIATPGTTAGAFLYRFALINYFVIFMNLIPLLELDGYWIFSDLIQVPDLRRRSLTFIQHDLWHKLRVWERFSWQEGGLAFYGIVGTAFTILSFYTAFFFWREIFGGLVTSLWDGGLVSRILLILLALAFIGPLIRGLFTLGKTITKRIREVVASARFRAERSWRIEAASLIDALPAFDDLNEEVLSDVAGRVTVIILRDGQTIFRRGDAADAFYVIRSGTIHIEDVQDDGDVLILSALGRGDAFGELGLLGSAPRAATARANGDVTLFRIDKASFDALLADDIDAPTFAPTMQAYAELRALPVFRTLTTADLALVLDHGTWLTPAPGEELIKQGEPGDAFYAIGAGQVDVLRDGASVATLGPGDHFGEVALLTDAPRNATVTAHTAMRVFRLDRQGFNDVVARSLPRSAIDRSPDRNMEH